MIHSGLVSITFRPLSPAEIVALAARAGLAGIEWGGDVHVPHGNVNQARAVRAMTEDAGLQVSAYGSYYRAGHEDPCPFADVLDTAVALGAPLIRVWAGKQGSEAADGAYRARVVEDSRQIAELAAGAGIEVAYEFHGNTLTDTGPSARALLEAVAHPNMMTYWQPPVWATVEQALETLQAILPWLRHVHVFAWRTEPGGGRTRLPLSEGEAAWTRYLPVVASTGREAYAELEFVQDDAPEYLVRDAATLREWLAGVNTASGR
jgi:sugar phosphate isomerase/epimerase